MKTIQNLLLQTKPFAQSVPFARIALATLMLQGCAQAPEFRSDRSAESASVEVNSAEAKVSDDVELGIAAAKAAPIKPATETSSATCNSDDLETKYSALDMDANGTTNMFVDGPLLLELMNGTFAKSKSAFLKSNGRRREFEVYYRRTLSNIGLDVDGNGKVDAKIDGRIIIDYMQMLDISQAPITKVAFEKAFGWNVNFPQLQKLFSKKLSCTKGAAMYADETFDLKGAAHYYQDEGGDGLVWVYSVKLKGWMYLDRKGDLFQWLSPSNPAKGILMVSGIASFYSTYPEALVDLQ